MPVFRSILVAADFSERSKEAFRVACSLAHETKTRIFVLHVVERSYLAGRPVAFGDVGMAIPLLGEDPERDEVVRGRLREEYAPHHPVETEYLVRAGDATAEVLRAAVEVGSDVIVLGTHGRTGLRRLLAGSVAEAVLRKAHCPVLALSAAETPREAGRVQVVLHPTDFSERSEAALEVARALARDHGARLLLLHVMPVEVVPYGRVPVPLDVAAVRDSLQAVGRGVEGADLKYPVETRLTQGDAAAEILRAAEEAGCGIVVMGTHGRTGLGRLLMGSVAEAVLRKASCPVLVVKAPTRGPAEPSGNPAGKPVTVV